MNEGFTSEYIVVEVSRETRVDGSRPWACSVGGASVVVADDARALAELVRGRVLVTWDATGLSALPSEVTSAARGIIDLAAELAVQSEGRTRTRTRSEVPPRYVAGIRPSSTGSSGSALGDHLGDALVREVEWSSLLLRELERHGLRTGGNVRLRGAYALLIGRANHRGLPLNSALLARVNARRKLVASRAPAFLRVDRELFDHGELNVRKAAVWARARGVEWPRAPNGHPIGDLAKLEELAAFHPWLLDIATMARWCAIARHSDLPAPVDDRLAGGALPMMARTGRDVLSPRADVFAWPRPMRRLLRPAQGWAIAYIDARGIDLAVAAGRSRDSSLLKAFEYPDPYTKIGDDLGLVRVDRAHVKRALLASLNGIGSLGLARVLSVREDEAACIRSRLRSRFSQLFDWQDRVLRRGRNGGVLRTPLGWAWQPTRKDRDSQIINFAVQAAASDVVRLAAVECDLNGLRVVGCVHDAIVIESPVHAVPRDLEIARSVLGRASERVLGGLRITTSETIVTSESPWPMSRASERFWRAVEWEPSAFLAPRGGYP